MEQKNNINIKGYEDLANAIVIQALKDLINNYETRKKLEKQGKPVPPDITIDIENLEKFFESDEYMIYTSVPGQYLIEKAKDGSITIEDIKRNLASIRK